MEVPLVISPRNAAGAYSGVSPTDTPGNFPINISGISLEPSSGPSQRVPKEFL